MKIRRPVAEDVDRLYELAKAMHRESRVWYPHPEKSCIAYFVQLQSDRDDAVAFVADTDNGVVGFINGFLTPFSFASERAATHECWYVAPAWRGGAAARLLMRAFIAWATERGACRVWSGLHTAVDGQKADRFMARFGFEFAGRSYAR